MQRISFLLMTFGFSLIFACDEEITRENIGTHIASPVAVEHVDHNLGGESIRTFFVLNADFNHKFSDGSILSLDHNGNKQGHIPTPRLGRVMKPSSEAIWVSFDSDPENNTTSKIVKYKVIPPTSTEQSASLQLEQEWDIHPQCSPLGLAVKADYPYFAVNCSNGELHVGSQDPNFNNQKLTHVRTIKGPDRFAMVIDSTRHLLYSFTTDLGSPRGGDYFGEDSSHWDIDSQSMQQGENDIPDTSEKTQYDRSRRYRSTSSFEFHVFGLEQEANKNNGEFIYRDFQKTREEFHWLYFDLLNEKGEVERENTDAEFNSYKTYRTNFSDATPDLSDPSERSLLLIHRGGNEANDGNQVVRMKLKDTVSSVDQINQEGVLTKDLYTFERVYGFGHEEVSEKAENCTFSETSEPCVYQRNTKDYLQSFRVADLAGQNYIFINQFRSFSSFTDPRYSLAAFKQTENDNLSYRSSKSPNPFFSTHPKDGLYGFDISPNLGDQQAPYLHIISNQFYRDQIKVFRFSPTDGITELTTIQ